MKGEHVSVCLSVYEFNISYYYREGDVSISDCPAYLYSYKPKTEEPPPIIERVPTPGIYDSIDNLSGGRLNPRGIPNPIITQLENENSNETNDDSTGSSVMS